MIGSCSQCEGAQYNKTTINLECKNNTTEFDECEIHKCIKIFLAHG
jgi:hypothetical protein